MSRSSTLMPMMAAVCIGFSSVPANAQQSPPPSPWCGQVTLYDNPDFDRMYIGNAARSFGGTSCNSPTERSSPAALPPNGVAGTATKVIAVLEQLGFRV